MAVVVDARRAAGDAVRRPRDGLKNDQLRRAECRPEPLRRDFAPLARRRVLFGALAFGVLAPFGAIASPQTQFFMMPNHTRFALHVKHKM
jgi:hypothetical protein